MHPYLRYLTSILLTVLLSTIAARADVPLLIFAGQSNMGGFQTDTHQLSQAELAEQPHVLFYGDNGLTWKPLNLGVRPTQPTDVAHGGFGFGPEATVGKDLVEAGVFPKVLEVKYIKNGSPSDSYVATPDEGTQGAGAHPIHSTWAPDIHVAPDQQSLYQGLLDRVKQARDAYTAQTGEKTRIAGFFWMQGESDANSSPEVAKLYAQNLQRFVIALRRDLGASDMPFIYGRIRHGKAFVNDLLVRAAEDNVAKPGDPHFIPNAVEVDTDSFPLSPDNIHFSSAGAMDLGHAMTKGFEAFSRK